MINRQAATVIKALRDYQKKTGGDELINNLGVMGGRIVRLSEQTANHIPLENTVKKQLLNAWAAIPIKPTTTITEYLTYLATEPGRAEIQCERLKEQVNVLKRKYETKLDNIKRLTVTNCFPFIGCKVGAKNHVAVYTDLEKEYGTKEETVKSYNNYEEKEWVFQNNKRLYLDDVFFMNHAVIYQVDKALAIGVKIGLPEKITRFKISNKKTIATLKRYTDNYDSQEFRNEYLTNTVNGKSTLRIATDFGLQIDRLSIEIKKDRGGLSYSVHTHVSPDPELYGILNEMD